MAEVTKMAQNEPNESPGESTIVLPSKDDLSIFLKDYKEYLAYQVAEAARQQLVSWAKWIIGVIALIITILGVKTFYDVQTKIHEAIQQELVKAQAKTKEALDNFSVERKVALDRLKAETDLVKTQAEQAGALI